MCSGLARRPLKAVARVRIPSGLQIKKTPQGVFFICNGSRFSHLLPPWHAGASSDSNPAKLSRLSVANRSMRLKTDLKLMNWATKRSTVYRSEVLLIIPGFTNTDKYSHFVHCLAKRFAINNVLFVRYVANECFVTEENPCVNCFPSSWSQHYS